ncbi:MAG TPA: 3-hydroxyacyl-CoA dehydrogenase NAD-binding domain-containing protein [Parapedobacter sp.]|uniref:3-hydroxyacyl-CoA dehydrogenase NAD-binding domain-containing protein n=1 Tax=Parapedobacter sp. TaxID=1958893 RepID=UPI002C6938CA|nr:3-hydroxyacyl-CoA dehydrogenase NAD-binding domain-containing protein [Parapedobacter sp.]HWK58499.1 3-hydroxyacyl-CoA dehydrogenase NAD-binding domain-containing protein [Parapedobacter sp.]
MNKPKDHIFIVGDGEPTYRVACNMLNAGQETVLLTARHAEARTEITQAGCKNTHLLTLLVDWPATITCSVAVAITGENAAVKLSVIHQLACRLDNDAIIAVNTESIPLDELQAADVAHPGRILGLNWCYPAELTFFLEIVANEQSVPQYVNRLATIGREVWGKDPYIVHGGFSVRARMMAAWVREAMYLVQNGHASVESIDRACRNDAGYYLTFAGNFRYMDLMGTYAYGMVMKDLNPDLSKMTDIPSGIEGQLATYTSHDSEVRKATLSQFSKEIRQLILKYPHEALDC